MDGPLLARRGQIVRWGQSDRQLPDVVEVIFSGYAHFANYEFVSPKIAWRRDYGFCSQVSKIVYSILRDQGYDATIMQHANQVVVEADGNVLDADYGVFIPHSLKYIQSRPETLDVYYGQDFASALPQLRSIYAAGWTESADKKAFDYMRAFEASARNWEWAPMLLALWLSLAVLDAGFCWPRFWRWTSPIRGWIFKEPSLS